MNGSFGFGLAGYDLRNPVAAFSSLSPVRSLVHAVLAGRGGGGVCISFTSSAGFGGRAGGS
jgi:hypothetical protein